MSQEDAYSRATDPQFDNSSAGTSGRSRRARSSLQENTETRFVHISDPSKMPKGKQIDEAVNTAFDDAKVKDASGISPELIAQITQNVIQQLKATETAQTPVTAMPGSPSTQDSPTRVYTPPSPQKHNDVYDTSTGGTRGPPLAERSRAESNLSTANDSNTRPRQPQREPTVEETTTLEKIWGKLFDDEGQPTARLGQFLRGLAIHLVG